MSAIESSISGPRGAPTPGSRPAWQLRSSSRALTRPSCSTRMRCCSFSWCQKLCAMQARFFNTGEARDMAKIRNEIRRLRFEHGEMTQQELAEKIEMTRQTVNAIEQGKYSPSLEAAFRIATVFGKPIDSVFHYSDE